VQEGGRAQKNGEGFEHGLIAKQLQTQPGGQAGIGRNTIRTALPR
jgi:hypothetical protein